MADQTRNDQGGPQGMGVQQGGVQGTDPRRNPADNLSREDRIRGGERSASMQQRDGRGQFAGRKNKPQGESGLQNQGNQQQGRSAGGGAGLGNGQNGQTHR